MNNPIAATPSATSTPSPIPDDPVDPADRADLVDLDAPGALPRRVCLAPFSPNCGPPEPSGT
jgi:hypothetical protein